MMNIVRNIQILVNQFRQVYYLVSKNYALIQALNNKIESKFGYKFDNSWNDANPTVCHALGEIDGILFTECKEAFIKHYESGSRVFELDFCLTSDGKAVVLHDWERFKRFSEIMSGDSALSHKQFLEAKILKKYTPLDMDRFVALAKKYDDAKFIISVKSTGYRYDKNVKKVLGELFDKTNAVGPDISKRYILHAYSLDFLDKAMAEYPFASVIYRCVHFLHPQVLAYELNTRGVNMVTILNNAYANFGFCCTMHDNDIKVIACACQKEPKARVTQIKKMKKYGADMIMVPDGEEINEKI